MQIRSRLSTKNIIRCIVLLAFSWVVYIPLDFFISRSYKSCLDFIFSISNKDFKNELLAIKNAEYVYEGLKVIPFLIFGWLLIIWIDFFRDQKRKTTRFFIRIADGIYNSILENKKYIHDLGKTSKWTLLLIISIQFVFCGYYLFNIPFTYDEFWSYLFFSGESYWATLSFYPVPNNHIFFNLVSRTFIMLPLNTEVMLRLPNLLASIITIYYFFKICKTCFNDTIALLLIACIIASYPFTMYSFLARGYMFVCLFYVLLIYASIKLFANYTNKKYRNLLTLSLFLGLLSVPTFLYALLPVVIVFFIHLLKQKRFNDLLLFLQDGLFSLLLVSAGYMFIVLFNPTKNLFNPDGSAPRFAITDPDAFNLISNHLKEITDFFMINEKFVLILSILIIVSSVWHIFKNKGVFRYLCVLSCIMFFSPLFILILHGTIPFARIWIYMIFPIALSLGFIITNVVNLVSTKFYLKRSISKVYTFSLIILFCTTALSRFGNIYFHNTHMDFEFDALRTRVLEPVIGKIKNIGYTRAGYEFYIADNLYSLRHMNNIREWTTIGELDTVKNQDILIIGKSKLAEFSKSLNNYKLLQFINGDMCVFGKDSLFVSNLLH